MKIHPCIKEFIENEPDVASLVNSGDWVKLFNKHSEYLKEHENEILADIKVDIYGRPQLDDINFSLLELLDNAHIDYMSDLKKLDPSWAPMFKYYNKKTFVIPEHFREINIDFFKNTPIRNIIILNPNCNIEDSGTNCITIYLCRKAETTIRPFGDFKYQLYGGKWMSGMTEAKQFLRLAEANKLSNKILKDIIAKMKEEGRL